MILVLIFLMVACWALVAFVAWLVTLGGIVVADLQAQYEGWGERRILRANQRARVRSQPAELLPADRHNEPVPVSMEIK